MNFVKAVETASKFAAPKSDNGLDTVQLVDGGSRVVAQDLRGGVVIEMDPPLGFEGAADAKRLLKAVKTCGDEPTLTWRGSILTVSGSGGRFRVPTRALADLPAIAKPPDNAAWIEAGAEDMAALEQVAWARSDDATRPHLTGVYLAGKSALAVNGHCLCQRQIGADLQAALGSEGPVCFDVGSILGLEGEAELCLGGDRIFVRDREGQMRVAKLLPDAHMPPVDQILNQASEFRSIVLDAEQLRATVSRAVSVSADIDVRLADGGKLQIEATDGATEFAFSHEIQAANSAGLDLGFVRLNGRYLAHAVSAIDASEHEVHLHVGWTEKGSLQPVLVAAGPCRSIIMPCRA